MVPVASLSDDARRLTVTSLQVCAMVGNLAWEIGRGLGGQAHMANDSLVDELAAVPSPTTRSVGQGPFGEHVHIPVNPSE